MATTKLLTADALSLIEDDGFHRYELIEGELRQMPPAGGEHGGVEGELIRRLGNHVIEGGLGRVYSGDTGFILARDPDTVLAPDVSFIRKDRLPPRDEQIGFLQIPPDLAVEIVSPWDRPAEVDEKARTYLAAGVPLVWVLWPRTQTVTVYHSKIPPRTLTAKDELDGGDVLPGFRVQIADLFP